MTGADLPRPPAAPGAVKASERLKVIPPVAGSVKSPTAELLVLPGIEPLIVIHRVSNLIARPWVSFWPQRRLDCKRCSAVVRLLVRSLSGGRLRAFCAIVRWVKHAGYSDMRTSSFVMVSFRDGIVALRGGQERRPVGATPLCKSRMSERSVPLVQIFFRMTSISLV